MLNEFSLYAKALNDLLAGRDWKDVEILAESLDSAWRDGKQIFLCGNGGSAANALHIANDLLYGVGSGNRDGLKVEALTSNTSVLTCLANDVGYEELGTSVSTDDDLVPGQSLRDSINDGFAAAPCLVERLLMKCDAMT